MPCSSQSSETACESSPASAGKLILRRPWHWLSAGGKPETCCIWSAWGWATRMTSRWRVCRRWRAAPESTWRPTRPSSLWGRRLWWVGHHWQTQRSVLLLCPLNVNIMYTDTFKEWHTVFDRFMKCTCDNSMGKNWLLYIFSSSMFTLGRSNRSFSQHMNATIVKCKVPQHGRWNAAQIKFSSTSSELWLPPALLVSWLVVCIGEVFTRCVVLVVSPLVPLQSSRVEK